MQRDQNRPRRSVLYVPAANEKALGKLSGLSCDAAIIDLEDAVAPGQKEQARETVRRYFAGKPGFAGELVIRINALTSEWGTEDLMAARACRPDAILVPKVDTPRDLLDVDAALDESDAGPQLRLWAMIETPRAVLNAGAIAELGRDPAARLDCFVAGTNDLVKETGIRAGSGRQNLQPLLLQIVLAAKAGGFGALDGVSNDFRDPDAFRRECELGRDLGFDGKTLIHPAQIEPANDVFTPSAEEVAEARAILNAFSEPANAEKGVVALDGRMVERLHLDQAKKVLARAGIDGKPR